jgi:hypothetical protein
MSYSTVYFTENLTSENKDSVKVTKKTRIRETIDEQNDFSYSSYESIIARAVRKVWGERYHFSLNQQLTKGAGTGVFYGQITVKSKTGGECCVTNTTKVEVDRYYSFENPKKRPKRIWGQCGGPKVEIGTESDWQPRIKNRIKKGVKLS